MRLVLRRALPLLLLTLLSPAIAAPGAVRRCVAADGSMIWTDRPCALLDASEETPEPQAPATAEPEMDEGKAAPATDEKDPPPLSSYGLANQDCARTPEQLRTMLEAILASHDLNALAGLYHWPGMGKWSARAVMDRLERLLAVSAGTVEPVYPEAAFVVFNPQAWPDLPPEDPIALRFPETSGDSPSPVYASELRVIRNAGCWWLHF